MIQVNYYIVATISIMVMLVGIFHLRENNLFSTRIRKAFSVVAVYIIVEIVIDTLFKVLEGNTAVPAFWLYLLKTSEFIMNPILCLLMVNVFNTNNSSKWFKISRRILIVIAVLNGIIQIISVCGRFVFYIDANNVYQRTNLTVVYVICLLISIALFVFSVNIYAMQRQNINKYTLMGCCTVLFAGIFVRLECPNTNFDWLCVAISYLVLIIYFFNVALRLDSLTQLLNRRVYDVMVSKINYTTMVIMIDANNFKHINDTFGHECGDRTLKLIAKCILKAYGENGYCFRIGGDEFCVILKENVFHDMIDKTPNSDVYVMSESFLGRLDRAIYNNYRMEPDNGVLKYGVAQGYAIYYLPSEYPNLKNNMPLDKVLRLADMRMYRKKKQFKEHLEEIENATPEQMKAFWKARLPKANVRYNDSLPELIEGPDEE